MPSRHNYRDYRTLLRHAGLPDHEVERIAKQAEEDDAAKMNEESPNDQQGSDYENEAIIEKHINMVARYTGIRLEERHAIMINGKDVEVTLYEGESFAISQLLDFANKLAAQGVGHDVKVNANSAGSVVLYFKLI